MKTFTGRNVARDEASIANIFGDEAPDKMLYLGALEHYRRLDGPIRDYVHSQVDRDLNTARLGRLLDLHAGAAGYLVHLKMEAHQESKQ